MNKSTLLTKGKKMKKTRKNKQQTILVMTDLIPFSFLGSVVELMIKLII